MFHSFDVATATKHGVECAIMISGIKALVLKNKEANQGFHNGRYWICNSVKSLSEFFPYWNSDKVRRVLEKLEENGLVLSDNFNTTAYDRTKWYTIAE